MNIRKKAVVTGIGLVTPIGKTKSDIVTHLRNGEPAIPQPVAFGGGSTTSQKAFFLPGNKRGVRFFDPVIRYGFEAAQSALDDAGIAKKEINDIETGVVISSSKGGVHSFARYCEQTIRCERYAGHRLYANFAPDCLSGWIARKWKIRGPVKNIVTACATGTHSIIAGTKMIEDGEVKRCLVGASDASIDPLMLSGYKKLGVYAQEMIRPFDKNRDGFLIGEGAGVLVIEEASFAQERGAHIYGYINEYIEGQETSNILHFSDESNALSSLIKRMGFSQAGHSVDYINAHATGTRAGDLYESNQIKKAFDQRAYAIPISSTKSFTGHLLGASGAVEAGICLLALEHNFIPPTVSLVHADENCDLDYVPKKAREQALRRIVSISMGFGGHIAILSFTREQ
jgi:3-oxoacyl-[acyl-carrier-protein] synthase II